MRFLHNKMDEGPTREAAYQKAGKLPAQEGDTPLLQAHKQAAHLHVTRVELLRSPDAVLDAWQAQTRRTSTIHVYVEAQNSNFRSVARNTQDLCKSDVK